MDIFSENDIPKLYFINVINVSVMIIDIFTNALFYSIYISDTEDTIK